MVAEDHLDPQDNRELEERWDLKGHREKREHLEKQERGVRKDTEDSLGFMVYLE